MISELITGIIQEFNASIIGSIFWSLMSIIATYKLIKEVSLDIIDFVKFTRKVGIKEMLIMIAYTLISFILPLICLVARDFLAIGKVLFWLSAILVISYIGTTWILVWLYFQLKEVGYDPRDFESENPV